MGKRDLTDIIGFEFFLSGVGNVRELGSENGCTTL